jgi:uncharacterized protein (DUF302 family)
VAKSEVTMARFAIMLMAGLLWGAHAMAAEGLTTIPSSYGSKETVDRFEAEVRANGMTVFARIDHAAGAAEAGLPLRPTELLIFGNARAGTPLMQTNQAIGIDLPLKALAWEDGSGKVWLAYNEPRWLAERHGLDEATNPSVGGMTAALRAIAAKAAAPP